MTQPAEGDGLVADPEPVLSDHDRRYQFTAPDDSPRYGLVIAVAGALIALIVLTVLIAKVADSSDSTEADGTLAGPDATQPEQTIQDQRTVGGFEDDQSIETLPANENAFGSKGTGDGQPGDDQNGDDEDAGTDRGDRSIAVPSLLGKPQAEVGTTLGALGITFSVVERPSDSFTKGKVIGTSPEAGQPIPPGTTLTVYLSSGPDQLSVPEVVGVEAAVAAARLTEIGLASNLVEVPSATVEAGVVVASRPAVGSAVADGTVIELSVSAGPNATECVEVPNVIGQKAPIAKGLLAQAGLMVEEKAVAHSAAVNTVVGTTPNAAQCADIGSTATISVSCASDIIPTVVGLPVELLNVAGFTVEKTTEATNEAPAGTVLEVTPAAGTPHCQSTPVAARVASGTGQGSCVNIAVPNLVGLNSGQAEVQAKAAGLVYQQTETYNAAVPNGSVVRTTPSSGASACPGTPISVVVSIGPDPADLIKCTITVPSVSLRPLAEVTPVIEALGLTTAVAREPHRAIPAGFVTGWKVDRGTGNGTLCPGDQILISVSTGPE